MGLRANIYKTQGRSSSNGGISTDANQVTIMNIDGPDTASAEAPAVIVVRGNLPNTLKVVEAMPSLNEGGKVDWVEAVYEDELGPMFGGCLVGSSDMRFNDKVRALTGTYSYALPLHDRYETPEQYGRLSA